MAGIHGRDVRIQIANFQKLGVNPSMHLHAAIGLVDHSTGEMTMKGKIS